MQKLTQSVEEAQKGMLDMATELRELRGLPELIKMQFNEPQEEHDGNWERKRESRAIAEDVTNCGRSCSKPIRSNPHYHRPQPSLGSSHQPVRK